MKTVVTLLSFLTISYSHANQVNCDNPQGMRDVITCNYWKQNYGNPPDGTCHECVSEESVHLVRATRTSSLPGLSPSFSGKGADCTNFIKSDGSYGPWGETVKAYVEGTHKNRFASNTITDITHACPNWANLKENEKTHFWVWVFAAIAHDESTCKSNARNPNASNGTAVGLLQLDDLRSSRRWRGPNCNVPSVTAASDNLKCGLDIMAELLKGPNGEYKGRGAIFSDTHRNTSYWQKLKLKGGGNVGNLIKTHPRCATST